MKALLSWYDRRKRALPWREQVTPYRTWISEIMLQQTTVAAVIPYFERFIEEFPDARALAQASQEEVLKAWAGLGYYSRARNLHRAAQKIVSGYDGAFPDTFEKALELPGVGRYTAGAVLSIAFGKPVPVLDGNVMRVFARYYGLQENIKEAATVKKMWALAQNLVPKTRPGDWNQALMELGATICGPEKPYCRACPVSKDCVAFQKGWQDKLPVMPARRNPVDLKWTCLWIERDREVLLWKREESERFLKNHWGLPELRHIKARQGRRLKTVRHTITHHKISVEVYEASLSFPPPPQAAWVARARLADYLVSSLWRKCAS